MDGMLSQEEIDALTGGGVVVQRLRPLMPERR